MNNLLREWVRARLVDLGEEAVFEVSALRVEASFREFHRVSIPSARPLSLVAMYSPPEVPGGAAQNLQFERLAEFLVNHQIPVPEVLAADQAYGFFLMSDLGSRHFEDIYPTSAKAAALSSAIETLHHLQHLNPGGLFAPYDRARLAMELGIFTQWFVEGHLQQTVPDRISRCFTTLIDSALAQPQVCIHRDYHCRNLLWSADRSPALGIVDFQDALYGPFSYDLCSLLYDCYATFSDDEVQTWVQVFLAGDDHGVTVNDFLSMLQKMAIQRMLKAIGIFLRLSRRDQRHTHIEHVYPVLDRVTLLAAGQPGLSDLAEWLGALPRPEPGRPD
ncbi:MAG: phosphotransferase [Proteobacteria bacterium]|nr:phosphotransferase [Pseudomonadota bacterium]